MQQLLDLYFAGVLTVGFLGLGLTTSITLVTPSGIRAWASRNMIAITILAAILWPVAVVALLYVMVRQTTSAF